MGGRSLLALSSAALLATGTLAATLTISPVTIWPAPGQNSAALQVRNSDAEPSTVQARIYRWTQAGDEDVLTPTSDIIVSPPIATIASGATQALRLLLRPGPGPGLGSAPGGDAERHYRVLLDEIPAHAGRSGALSFAMRASIPVFVLPRHPADPLLNWRATRAENGTVLLTAANSGAVYDRVVSLVATSSDGVARDVQLRGTNTYVLPSAQRRWVVQAGSGPGPLHLRITTRSGSTEQILPIDP